jgi:A/G-specific adenine glycosylase
MLQQTQVNRVIDKYLSFIAAFPNIYALARAPLNAILAKWQGLGYNRRALYLKQTAVIVSGKLQGVFPTDKKILQSLPGIGPNTAGAILAYAFNIPALFIETNIRSVYLHHFFPNKPGIHDREIIPLIKKTIDLKNPREWYWALMDYGTFIKKTYKNPGRESAHYSKQSVFSGSARQLRGQIIRELLKHGHRTKKELLQSTDMLRGNAILDKLIEDGLIILSDKQYTIRQN